MSEKEKEILKKVASALPKMSDYDKGYIMGLADGHRKEEVENAETENPGNQEDA